VEVDKQTHWLARKTKIGKQLRIMDRDQVVDSLYLYHDRIFNDQIETVSAVKFHMLVHDRQRSLLLNLESNLSQFVR